MFKLLYAGFDTLDIAIAGALPIEALQVLETAREEAAAQQEPQLTAIGPGAVDMHVSGHGMRGGYAFVMDTGPLGAKWMVKNNTNPSEWNVFVSPRATMLLAYGWRETRDRLWQAFEAMGGRIADHSLNRVDFAMDFQTQGFELHQDQFVAHSHTKVSPHWGKQEGRDLNQPAAVLRGRRLESVTIGKQPGRQIIVYDKRREAIERQKRFWFEAWGLDRHDPSVEVWRVEVRAGKKELKDKYQIRRFEDFEAGIGDVMANALNEVRYLDDRQSDSNVSRHSLHSLWLAAQQVASGTLIDYCVGLTPGRILEVEIDLALQRYTALVVGNAIGMAASTGMSNEELREELPKLTSDCLTAALQADEVRIAKRIARTRARLHFVSGK